MIWNHDVADIMRGWCTEGEEYVCLICGQRFEQGRVYPMGDAFYDAQGAVRRHVQDAHGGMTEYLLAQETGSTGLTEVQRQLLSLMAQGRSDAEISQEMGIAPSTVRNHRFKLREKEKQAKMFLALMGAMEQQTQRPIGQSDNGPMVEVPSTAKMIDERYGITEEKRRKTVDTYFNAETGALKQFPAREKKKIIVLMEIAKNFRPGQEYSEKEVNRILQRIYEEDYVTLRRYLIEYGFMDRSDDCRVYRIKE